MHTPTLMAVLAHPDDESLGVGGRGGEVFVSNAIVAGRYLLRACIVNFHTARSDVEALPEIVVRIGHIVDAELRRTTAERQ